jgi:ribosomal protein L6P/L9E
MMHHLKLLIQVPLLSYFLYNYLIININIQTLIFKILLINSCFSNLIFLNKKFLYNCYFLPHKIFLNCKSKQYSITIITIFNNVLTDLLITYKKYLIIKGLFFKIIKLKNSIIKFELGYSHAIKVKIPRILKIYILNKKQTKFILLSNNRQFLINFIKLIKNIKKINPYKKQGIFIKKEFFKLKTGKKKFQ